MSESGPDESGRAGGAADAGPMAPCPRWRGVAAESASILLTGVAALGLALYVQRGAVGASLAVDYLARQGVPALIRFHRLDASGFEASVRLGPPDDPDFTADDMVVTFLPAPVKAPGGGVILGVKSVRLYRPRLKARFAGGRLTFGTLQPLVDAALRAKPSGGPGVDLALSEGRAVVLSPAGRVAVSGDLALAASAVQRAALTLAPTVLSGRDARGRPWRVALGRGRLGMVTVDGWTRATLRLPAPALSGAGAEASGAVLAGQLQLSQRAAAGARPFRLTLHLTAPTVGVSPGGWTGDALAADAVLDGTEAQVAGGLSGTGRGRITLAAARVGGSGATARAVRLRADLGPSALSLLNGRGRLDLQGTATGGAEAISAAGVLARQPSLTLNLTRAGGALGGAGALAGVVDATLRAPSVQMAKGSGRALRLHAAGPVRWLGGLTASLTGDAEGGGALAPTLAGRLAASAPVSPEEKRALRAGLGSLLFSAPGLHAGIAPRVAILVLTRPATLRAGTALAATLSAQGGVPALRLVRAAASGGGRLALQGPGLPSLHLAVADYAVAGGAARARGEVALDGDVGPARGVAVSAGFSAEGAAGRVRLALTRCADLAVTSLAPQGRAAATGVSGHVCPADGPLLALAGGQWRTQARVEGLSTILPDARARVGVSGRLNAAGSGSKPRAGTLEAARVTLADLAPRRRFGDLAATGRADLAGLGLQGRFDVSEAASGRGLGVLTVQGGQEGEATFDTGRLAFAKGGLQPAEIAAAAKPFAAEAVGTARLTAHLGWGPAGLTSAAKFETDDLDFRSPAGPVKGLKTAIDFASLAPLRTAPGQRVTARALTAVLPLTDLSAGFSLQPDRFVLDGAQASVAGGVARLDSLTVPLTPGATIAGTARLAGIDAGQVLGAVNLGEAVKLNARLSGVVPFTLSPEGLRFSGGKLAADGPGRLTLSRRALQGAASGGAVSATSTKGALPAAPAPVQPPPGAVEDLAYQALEDLAFERLDARVDSQPKGRLGVVFHIEGRHDPAVDRPTRLGLIELVRGRAFDKPIPLPKGTPVTLTLDTSLNFDELMAAYRQFGAGGVGADPGGSAPVQPPGPSVASDKAGER